MIKKIGLIAVSTLIIAAPFLAQADTLTRYLSVGMSGSDVSAAQSFLAQDATLYPQGLVTGYFGSLTKSAVINFQVRNDIVANSGSVGAGRIGPATLPVMNMQMANGVSNSSSAAIISNPTVSTGRTSATVNWNTNENARGVVYYSTSPLNLNASLTDVGVSGGFSAMTDSNFSSYQSISLSNLQANTTYYYMAYSTNQNGGVSVTWPSTFQTSN